ncbi:hypothetical protein P154DRAFT_521657, partial [Amniculicola lignicola CBS 123094]
MRIVDGPDWCAPAGRVWWWWTEWYRSHRPVYLSDCPKRAQSSYMVVDRPITACSLCEPV